MATPMPLPALPESRLTSFEWMQTIANLLRGSVLFLAILLNALTAISEIDGLYAQRPIVEKHNSYAFYHPFVCTPLHLLAGR